MRHALLRNLTQKNPCMVRGEGIYLIDSHGKRYIDGASGSSLVCNNGHGVREVAAVLTPQAAELAYNPFHCSHSQAYEEMAERLVRLAPQGFGKVFSVSSGSEAVENAVKFGRQYQAARGLPSKHLVISRWQSYHGNTLAALAYSGYTGRRRRHAPTFKDAVHIPPAFCYRCYFEMSYPSCALKCARALETAILQEGSQKPSLPPIITSDKMKVEWYKEGRRHVRQHVPVHERGRDTEIEQGLTEADVLEEAKRCMSCGLCMDCETCWMYCTNSCFVKLPKGQHYKVKLEVCNGFKKCAEQCPCGYIDLI